MQLWYVALAQASPANQQSQLMSTLTMMAILFAIFYFLLIRPQQKQAKERRAMLAALKKGDNVVVAGGIHARIMEIGEGVLVVEIADKVRIKVNRDSVVGLLQRAGEAETGKKTG